MINFLNETIAVIEKYEHSIDDILYIGSDANDFKTDWKTFSKYANFNYDNGYGGQNIADDLVVVFNDDTWLERVEYDGAESWKYKKLPEIKSTGILKNKSILRYYYKYL